MKRVRGRIVVWGVLLSLLGTAPAWAAPTPKQIIDKAMEQQVFRAKGVQMRIAMLIKNKRGEKRERTMGALSLRKDGISRTIVRVEAPADVRGMGFLFVQQKNRPDDQFMYMPALRVAKRIVGSNKKASFLGSQFTYADLEWNSLEHASYQMLPEEKIGKEACWVIDARPTDKGSAYTRLRVWVRKSDSAMRRLAFFDQHDKQLKVLFVKKIETISGLRMATRLRMKNVQNGEVTLLAISGIRLRDDLSLDAFTVRALKKQ